MATGGENEDQTVGGLDILGRLIVEENESLAAVLRVHGRIQQLLPALRVDIGVTQGTGVQIQRTVEEAANKLKLSFQAIGKADDLQTGFRNIESHLQQIVADAEKANQALSITLKGPSGEGTYALKGKQGVSELIARLPEYARALGPGNAPITAGISANMDPSRVNLQSVEATRAELGAITAKTKAEQDAERQTKKTVEQGEKLSKWMEIWSSGGRPQRSIAMAIQGPLSSLMGAEGGAMMAGLGGMIGGGALFHMGWEITNQLAKIPSRIGEYVKANQEIDIMRAGMMAQPGLPGQLAAPHRQPFDPNSASSDAELMAKYGAGAALFNRLGSGTEAPDDFTSTLQTLQTESNKLYSDPAQRRIWMQRNARFAAMATFGKLFAGTGDPLTVANALQSMQMHESPEAMQTLLNQPGMRKSMVDTERKGMGYGGEFSDEWIWGKMQERLTGAYGIRAPSPSMRATAREQVYNAFASMLQNPSALSQAQTAIAQWHPGTDLKDALNKVIGTKEKLSESDWAYITGNEGSSRALMYAHSRGAIPFNGPPLNPDRQKFLDPMRKAWGGEFGPMLGGTPNPFEAMQLQMPRFSFSSLSEFANKMQTEASIHMTDYAEKTATNTDGIKVGVDKLVGLVEKGAVLSW